MYKWRGTYKKGHEMRLVIEERSRIDNQADSIIPSDVRSRSNGTRRRGIGPCMVVHGCDWVIPCQKDGVLCWNMI